MSVVEAGYLDGIANGVNGCDIFPDLLNILDFPEESLEGDDSVGDWDASMLQCLGPVPSDALMGLSPVHQANVDDGPLRMALKSKAFVDSSPLQKDKLNYVQEITGAALLYPSKYFDAQQPGVFQTQSPVSVLETSISYSGGKTVPIKSDITIPVRTRSKRARPAVNPWILIPPLSSTAASKKTSSGAGKKTRGERKMAVNDDGSEVCNNGVTPDQACSYLVKKCTHCEVTKTPQWREGPMGPKTLCNACGVRYRSGRLFPEYRPAASPTFVPMLHSNSHRKVVEMRRKAIQEAAPIVEDSLKRAAETRCSALQDLDSFSRGFALTH
ncbi:PREDICTED: GATA transcription factor 11-like [Ipomoea nil]|uniref:GATA transcription factor 11-like n=1 Tax=Ipomoea nil TaxID=35883 RepID=UPI00090100F1|nr:PREDICTED: GATA transcription factor 11-like [Ipomoea nil]